jgi:cytochrome c-type biogenesis protein CcmE
MALSTGTRIGLGLIVAGSIAFLVLSDTGEGVLEYVYVDKVMEEPARYSGRTLKVHGIVVEGSIKKKKGSQGDFTFVVEHGGHRMPVHYTNIPPDTFQEGGEVVLTGRLNSAGDLFESDEMSAKCPSKYEEQQKVQDPTQKG